jgi:hypothetical protein
MKVLAEYKVVGTGEWFHEEGSESNLPKPGGLIFHIDAKGIKTSYKCVEQVGSFVYNMKKQIYQYTFSCEKA